jgi:hypothetical protein
MFSRDAKLLRLENSGQLNLRTYHSFILSSTIKKTFRGIRQLSDKVFNKLLLDAVDGAFSSLGDSAKQSIYFHLETKFKVSKDQIPCRLEDFENGLENIFGVGTRFLEILIMKKLYETMKPKGRSLKWDEGKEFKFTDYVRTAEQVFSRGKK